MALMTTIYAICNHVTGEAYIGESSEPRVRWYQHRYTLQRGCHSNKSLQAAYAASGEGSFGLVILERIPNPECKGAPWKTAHERRWCARARAAGIVLYNDQVGKGCKRAA